MKKRIGGLLLCAVMLAGLLPTGIAPVPVAAEPTDYSAYRTENVEVPEGWDYVEVSTPDELRAAAEKHDGWGTDGQPLFIRLVDDIEVKDRWVGKYCQACLTLSFTTSTVLDFNGHTIFCDINAEQNGDNHTWYGLNLQLSYGVVPDYCFRLVDSVGGGGVSLDAHTDVDGPTTAVLIQGCPMYTPGWTVDDRDHAPYCEDGAKVYIDGGIYCMATKNDKFCLVQGGPMFDSAGFPRWDTGYVPYARSALALDGITAATINNGLFSAYRTYDEEGVVYDMGRRFLSDLGLCDSQSASHLTINGGKFKGGCYSVYQYDTMSLYADEDYDLLKKLDPMPVINGGAFKGGIQFCSTRTSFWRKLQGKYDLNPKMKDVKVSEVLFPGAEMYMDGKQIDPDKKDLEDIAWPHEIVVEPGPQILNTRLLDGALPLNGDTRFLVHYNKTPDSVRLEEYITVIRLGQTQSYWTEAEGSYYTLQTALGENWYNFFVPKKTSAGVRKFRALATFGETKVYSDEFEVEWVDVSDLGFTYGPVVHDGNGEGVAYVEFDLSNHDLVSKFRLNWSVHGDYWQEIEAPSLTPSYNNGLYRIYIPELADKDADSTTYCVMAEYDLDGLLVGRESDSFVITEAILGAPMDPYSVGLNPESWLLSVNEMAVVKVTLFPTAAPHKTGFTAVSSDEETVQVMSVTEEGFTVRGLKPGKATVTVTAQGGAYAECEVTVAGDFLPGDVDGDGSVTSTDARLVLQLSVNKITETDLPVPAAADVDRDGSITSTDARLILQKSVGKITDWP